MPQLNHRNPRHPSADGLRLRLRGQAFADPVAIAEPVTDAVVQPGFASLPEFPVVGYQSVTTPVLRARWVKPEAGGISGGIGQQHTAIGDYLRLGRRPGPDPRIERTNCEIGVRFFGADLFDEAFDAEYGELGA